MADYIQSRVYIYHRTEVEKPTTANTETTTTPTSASKPEELVNKTTEEQVTDQIDRKLGRTSVQRRLINMTVNTAMGITNHVFDKSIYNEQFLGNTRGAAKLQQKKAVVNAHTQVLSSGVTAGITAVALNNPVIAVLWGATQLMSIAQSVVDHLNLVKQFNLEQQREIFNSNERRERLALNTYNRRG